MMQQHLRFLVLLGLLALLAPGQVMASHIAGADVNYEYIGPDTIRVHVYWYTDCGGNPGLPILPTDPWDFGGAGNPKFGTGSWSSPGGCNAPTNVDGRWFYDPSFYAELAPACDDACTECDVLTGDTSSCGSNEVPDINVAHYYADFAFDGLSCTQWTFSFSQSARNNGILTNGGGGTFYTSIDIDLANQPKNNSPIFTNKPAPFLCLNETFTFNQGAIDPDGDSLAYRFGPCLQGAGNPVNYINGFRPDSFISTPPNTGVNMDPTTGDITVTPSQTGAYIGCVFVDEYRNGVRIGTTPRDIQFTVLNCSNQLPEISGIADTSVNIPPDTLSYFQCGGDSIVARVWAIDPDTSDTLELSADTRFLPNDSIQIERVGDTATLILRHPPLPPRSKPYTFTVRAEDDGCPVNGTAERTIKIFIGESDFDIGNFATSQCNVGKFSAPVFGGQKPFSYDWRGPGGLTNNPDADQPSLQHTYPDTGTYKYEVEVTDGFGCSNVDSGKVNIPKAGIDDKFSFPSGVCQFDTVTYAYTGQDTGAQFLWQFGANAIPSTATGPGPHDVTYIQPGNKQIHIEVEDGGCELVRDTILNITSRPNVGIQQKSPLICRGDSVQLDANIKGSTSGCTYQWHPKKGLSNTTVANPVANPTTTTTYYVTVNCGGCNSIERSVTVKVANKPTATVQTSSVSTCLGGNGVTLKGGGQGGTGSLGYQWYPDTGLTNPYIPQPKASPSAKRQYNLVVTDSFGCTDTAYVNVDVDKAPSVDAGRDTSFCASGQNGVKLSPTVSGSNAQNFEYQWSPAKGLSSPKVKNPLANPNNTTTYTLSVTDPLTGCNSSQSPNDTASQVTVKVRPAPMAQAGQDVAICKGDSVQLGATPLNGGAKNLDFEWTPRAGLSDTTVQHPIAHPQYTTTYYVRAEDSTGCSGDADSVTVTVKGYPTVNLDQDHEICPGDSVQLQPKVGGISGKRHYRWVPAQGLSDSTVKQPYATPRDTTTYRLYVSVNGCETPTPDSTTVRTYPTPVVNADTAEGSRRTKHIQTCAGDSVQLPAQIEYPADYNGSAPINYYWQSAPGLNKTGQLRPKVAPQQTTNYILLGYIGNRRASCLARDTVKVVVKPTPQAQISAAQDTICSDESVNLTLTGGLQQEHYQWLPNGNFSGSQQKQIAVAPDSTATFSGVVSLGSCNDTAQKQIAVKPAPKAAFQHSYASGCQGLQVIFDNNSKRADSYTWKFGDGTVSNQRNPKHKYDAAGTYTVTLTASHQQGCANSTLSRKIQVGGQTKAAFASQPQGGATMVLPDAQVRFDSKSDDANTYLWQFGDGQVSEAANPVHSYQRAGRYKVKLRVTDDKGCTYQSEEKVYVVKNPAINVPNVFTPNGDDYNDEWIIQYDGPKQVTARIVDRAGHLVYEAQGKNLRWNGIMPDGNPAKEGTYFYVIEIGDKTYKGNLTLLR